MKAAKKPEGYNGWSNYETWCVALWLDNEEGSYRYWRDEAAQEALAEVAAEGKGDPAILLADRLKSEMTEAAPDLGATLWSDLLSAALSEVNWFEIAKGMIDESR